MASLAEVVLLDWVPKPLTYRLPGPWQEDYRGLRVRVPLGARRVSGVLWQPASNTDLPEEAIRPVLLFQDLEPLLPSVLLELAEQVAAHYLSPLGAVLGTVFPSESKGTGDRRVQLGAGSVGREPRNSLEKTIRDLLLERGPVLFGELPLLFPAIPMGAFLDLVESAWIRLEGPKGEAPRYELVFEAVPLEAEDQKQRLGRSRTGPAVLKVFEAARRPLTLKELTAHGFSRQSLRQLEKLGLVRSFDQPVRLDLAHHLVQATSEGAGCLELLPDQVQAVRGLEEVLQAQRFEVFLLEGPTGSGKTEVFLRATQACLAQQRSVLLLVPEIALVPALGRRARQLFGERVAILHSALSRRERGSEWERLRRGEALVVVGPRSAVWAPALQVGLIVLDEEQDTAFKQEKEPRYHAREVALLRGKREGAVVLLVSATPSLEVAYGVRRGRIRHLRVSSRFGPGAEPVVVDLRQEYRGELPGETILSRALLAAMEQSLRRGGQVLLLRNRRGYAPLLLCRKCGEDFRCPDCGLPRTWHRKVRRLVCHWCGGTASVPSRCPSCQAEALVPVGSGTERVEEQLRGLFPGIGIGVLDRDHVRGSGGVGAILERFLRKELQVLVGTQMLSKGHHFPDVELAAVLDADSYWSLPDFRAAERAYALFVQMGGRAGRAARPGRFFLQTFRPDHYVVQAVVRGDREGFLERELRFRELFGYPPTSYLARVLSENPNKNRAAALVGEVAEKLQPFAAERGIRLQGPAPAPMERLRGRWRFQLLVLSSSRRELRAALESALAGRDRKSLQVDVDPLQLL